MNDFEKTLGTALRERVDRESPDLQRLVEGSVHVGLRLRRRRRVGMAAAGVAGVAAIAVGSSLLGGGDPVPSSEPTLATEPSAATPSPTQQTRPVDTGLLEEYLANLDVSYSVDGGRRSVQVPADVTSDQRHEIAALTPRGWEVEYVDFNAPPVGLVTEVPTTVPKGWECEWFLVDDKAACTAKDGGVASLVIRDAADHAEWTSSPDKGGPGSGAYVTGVHEGIFISVQGGRGTTDAELRGLRDGLTWVD